MAAEDTKLQMNNEGALYVRNRAARRKKPMKARRITYDYVDVLENYTKKTHKTMKRKKNVN